MTNDLFYSGYGWIHLVAVHILTGSFFILFLTESISNFTGKPEFFKVGSVLYPVLVFLFFLTAGSGLYSKSFLQIGGTEAGSTLDSHQSVAFLSVLIFALAGYVRLSQFQKTKKMQISTGYLIILLLAFLVFTITAILGGKLVFYFGIGVHP